MMHDAINLHESSLAVGRSAAALSSASALCWLNKSCDTASVSCSLMISSSSDFSYAACACVPSGFSVALAFFLVLGEELRPGVETVARSPAAEGAIDDDRRNDPGVNLRKCCI